MPITKPSSPASSLTKREHFAALALQTAPGHPEHDKLCLHCRTLDALRPLSPASQEWVAAVTLDSERISEAYRRGFIEGQNTMLRVAVKATQNQTPVYQLNAPIPDAERVCPECGRGVFMHKCSQEHHWLADKEPRHD